VEGHDEKIFTDRCPPLLLLTGAPSPHFRIRSGVTEWWWWMLLCRTGPDWSADLRRGCQNASVSAQDSGSAWRQECWTTDAQTATRQGGPVTICRRRTMYVVATNLLSPNSTLLVTSRLDTTRHIEPVELVVSRRAVWQARHGQNAWARHVECVLSRRDATSQVEFGL